MTAPSLFSTMWIPLKIKLSKQWDDELIIDSINLTEGPFKGRRRGTSIEDEVNGMFQSEEKMDALIAWMRREWSAEAMLSLIEMSQFKESLIQHIAAQNKQFADSQAAEC